MKAVILKVARQFRHQRIRKTVKGNANRPRLCVFRSLNHIYAQIIDDDAQQTIAFASSNEPEIKGKYKNKKKIEVAEIVGQIIAKRALEKNISVVVFDRGGHKYHGRVKALAESSRKVGLVF